ncbi:isoform X1 [Orobanche hederae]
MERRQRTGGERGGRGMEENTMAILDTSSFSNSKISHHIDDDRASCFYGSSENLFFPIMEDTGLFDLPLHRRSFTWYRADGTYKSRIDRMMVNADWLSKCPGSVLLGACRGSFDHCTLILQLQFVKVKWEGYASEGWAGFILKEKLKSLKADLKWWSKNIYGILDNRVKDRKEVLERLDAIDDSRGLGKAEIIERNKLRALLIRDLKERNIMLRQKAKAKWVVEGDKNTSYFHRCINGRLKSNEIVELMINDRWSEDVEEVKNAARDKFKAHFSEVQICRPKLRSNFFLTKTNEKDNARLIAKFMNAETIAIKMCEAIFRILKDVDSLDLIIESYQLLVKLDKRFPRVYLSKQEQADSSSPSKVIPQVIMVEEAWVPFNLGLDSYNEKGAAKNHSGSSIDSSGFHALIHEIDEVCKGTKSEGNETTFLKNMLLLQYLISVLEGDFIPRNCAYHESMNWTLLRESLLHMLLGLFAGIEKNYVQRIIAVQYTVPTYEALESKNGKETINSSSIQFVTIGERGVVRIWNSDGAVLLFEQKSSDLAVSSKKEEVKRGFPSAMMLPLGQGLLCATVDEQFLIYGVDKHADGGLNLFMRKRLIGYEIAATRNLD